jgi:CPA2 family monovalent cation:H+ antiporter-2
MHVGEDLLVLGTLLVVAYVLGRLGKLIGLPTIPIYMVVGLLASPNTDFFPLDFESGDIELIAVFGLILLLFSLGLEFDQEEFFGNAKTLIISGGSWILINMGAGFIFGLLVGWGPREALVIAGMTGTSSSAIITKLLIELRRLANKETPMILGVTVVGDIFIAIYLSCSAARPRSGRSCSSFPSHSSFSWPCSRSPGGAAEWCPASCAPKTMNCSRFCSSAWWCCSVASVRSSA